MRLEGLAIDRARDDGGAPRKGPDRAAEDRAVWPFFSGRVSRQAGFYPSAARRAYDAEHRVVTAHQPLVAPTAVAASTLDFTAGWDQEARQAAWDQAQAMAHSDPEAAAVLMVQLTTSAPAALGQALGVREGYNPIRLYAIIAERCHWTIAEIRKTDYRTLWGIMRELVLLDREREKAKGTP